MFKKLKDKIEEVKQSPLKSVQQLTQAVVSPSSSSVFEPSSSNDKFCIEEGDIEEEETKTQTEVKTGGFTSVALTGQITSPLRDKRSGFRSSTSSFTTEVENLFPKFDSQPTNFHVQSDWESASEMEDRYSQLEHINKESLYEAYRKVYNRYNKMKNKYQELVTHYRLLEREKDKASTVLAETQDKTLMRISELKEQCLLEQQAKAHLEEALRNELEERDHIINSLKTKVQYLKTVSDGTVSERLVVEKLQKEEADNLIDFTENSCVSKVPLPSDASFNKESIPWLEEQLERCKKFLSDKTSKLERLEREMEEWKMETCGEEKNLDVASEDIHLDKQVSTKKHNMYLSLTHLLCKLEEEAKTLRINRADQSPPSNVNLQPIVRDNTEGTAVFVNGTSEESGTNITSNCTSTHNVSHVCDGLKELEKQNELIKLRLEEEITLTGRLRNEINALSEIMSVAKTKLTTTKEDLEKGNLDKDTIIVPTENEMLNQLNCCIINLYGTKKELLRAESLKEKLEIELKSIKDKISTIKVDKAFQTENNQDRTEISIEKLMVLNDDLKQELKNLKNEYNVLLGQESALSSEVNDLKLKNQNLEERVKHLKSSLELSEKECNIKQEALQKASLDFDREKCILQKTISIFEEESEKIKRDSLLYLETKENLMGNLSVLKEENNNILREKEVLKSDFDQLNIDFEQCNSDKETLSHKVVSLSEQNGHLISENKLISEQMDCLKKNKEKTDSDLLLALEDKDKIYGDCNALSEKCDNMISERSTLNEKINSLKKELESTKKDLANSIETVTQRTDELSSLKKEYNNMVSEINTLNEKIKSFQEEIVKTKEDLANSIGNTTHQTDELSSLQKQYNNMISEKSTLIEKINNLEEECKNTKKDHADAIQNATLQTNELSSLHEECDYMVTERLALNEKINNLEKELENAKTDLVNSIEDTTQRTNELSSLQKEYDNTVSEKNTLSEKVRNLEEEFEKTRKELLNSNENTIQLSDTLCTLRKTQEKLLKDKKDLKKTIEEIRMDFNRKIAEEKLSTEKKITSDNELASLKKELDECNLAKGNLQSKIRSLEEDLKNTEKELISSVETSRELSNTIVDLKLKCEASTNQTSAIQKEFNKLLISYEKNNEDNAQVLEVNTKLADELAVLKKEYGETIKIFNTTKKQLEEQEKTCSDLNVNLSASSDALKAKCDENKRLKTDVEHLSDKLNRTNCAVESITKDKQSILDSLSSKLDTVRSIKQAQLSILHFIHQLRVEMIKELNDVKHKVGSELMSYAACSELVVELESKSKQDIDSYNSKIKSLQTEHQKDQLCVKENSQDWFSQCVKPKITQDQCNGSGDEKLQELGRNILVYQNRCNRLEVKLNEAMCIMRSFRNLFINSYDDMCLMDKDAIFDDIDSEEHTEFNKVKNNEIKKELAAMESFIRHCETKYSSADTTGNTSGLSLNCENFDEITTDSSNYPLASGDTIRYKEGIFQKTDSSNLNENNCKRQLVKPLQQEVKVEGDFVNNTQSNYLQDERLFTLEEENKSLLEKLENIQVNHDFSMQTLIAKYEKKLEEKMEEMNIYDFEKLGAENRYIVNEMKEQIENLQQDLDERGDAFEKLYEQHQLTVKNREEEVQQLRNNYEKEMREQDKKWRSCLDRRLAEEETRYQEEMAQLTREWTVQRKELETASRLAVKAVESGSSSSDMLRRQVQALTLQLTELQSNRCEMCDHQRALVNERLRSITSKYSQDCTEMEYLRNILYEYMMGKEPMVLARVLCALMKFDENQTRDIVMKEKQKVTVFGQLGIL